MTRGSKQAQRPDPSLACCASSSEGRAEPERSEGPAACAASQGWGKGAHGSKRRVLNPDAPGPHPARALARVGPPLQGGIRRVCMISRPVRVRVVLCGLAASPKGRRGADQAARAAAGGKRERRDRRNEQTRPAPRRGAKLPASRFGRIRTDRSHPALSARAQPCRGQDGRGRLRSGRGRPDAPHPAEPQSPDRHRAKVTVSAAST